MPIRKTLSFPQNRWFDSENVDDEDLTLEQEYNNQAQSNIILNHIGTGVLPDSLEQRILFDSANTTGLLDGTAIDPDADPTDITFGSQLEIELKNSEANGRRSVKVAVIGLDFENNLQYDTFYFRKNEKQLTSKHYIKILTILTNDFIGATAQSFNLGGQLIIREALPFSLSRDAIMIAQDVEPNLFWRDFYVTSASSLSALLINALPEYNTDTLDISTGYKQLRTLEESDVVSHIGQKFIAKTNNIQKITLLLSAVPGTGKPPLDISPWTGELVISVYPLQSVVDCSADITPGLAIDFDPSNIPLVQTSINYNTLLAAGIILDSVPQPIDFVFSNTSIASGSNIEVGKYYAVTIKRSGTADNGIIQVPVGNDKIEDSRATIFTSDGWVDIPEEDLWFQIWTDAAKISDGQGYDNGFGITIPKTKENSKTGIEEDFAEDKLNFVRNETYYGLIQAVAEESTPVQDERTGEPVFSRKQNVVDASLITSSSLSDLEKTFHPFVVGAIADKNRKSVDTGASANTSFGIHAFTIVKNELYLKVIDDITDPRYDANILTLVTKFLNGSFNNAKLIINTDKPDIYYKISDVSLISLIYGDINDDGVVDENDLLEIENLEGYSLITGPTTSNEYIALTEKFTDDSTLSFTITDSTGLITYASGSDGILTPNVIDDTVANFNSASTDFSLISSISTKVINITSANLENNGRFFITGTVDANNISIKKQFYSGENYLKIFKADITGNFSITSADTSLISDYVFKTDPFPITSAPGNKIGTRFNVLKIRIQQFQDRNDNYTTATSLTRNDLLHPIQDIFINDIAESGHGFDGYGLDGYGLLTDPVTATLVTSLGWESDNISVSSDHKNVISTFTTDDGLIINSCILSGDNKTTFPLDLDFDPGRNDQFIPNNLILGFGGEIKRPDGYFYKVDLEVGNIVIEIPAISFSEEKSINIFTDFVFDYSGTGYTRLGLPAMRFADCSFVGSDALALNQLRFLTSIQSFSPNLDGYDSSAISGVVVDGRIGVYMDYSTGLLHLNFTNLYEDLVVQTLSTKVQVTVMIKKAGFNNQTAFFDSDKSRNLLGLDGLPAIGGSGITAPPFQYDDDLVDPQYDATSNQEALDAIKGLLAPGGTLLTNTQKQRIVLVAGSQSTNDTTYTSVSTFDFDPSEFYPSMTPTATIQIIFKVAIETTSGLTGYIRLYNQTLGSAVTSSELSTSSGTSVILTSSTLTMPTSTNIYEVHIRLDGVPAPTDLITCKLAQLEISFS